MWVRVSSSASQCGSASVSLLCGVYERRETTVGSLEAMLEALPGHGVPERWRDCRVGMARRELAPDATRVACPRQNGCPGLAIAADVRLDNRSEVGDALGFAGPKLADLSDDELVLRAYERWGHRCPEHLVGDYAFAIWDSVAQQMFCARDAVGARPFYYSASPDRFLFASDVDAVLAAGIDASLDEVYVATVLLRRTPSRTRTFFRAVRTLPPGHSLTVGARTERTERWWRPENSPPVPSGSDDDYAAAFLDHYVLAVRDRLRGPCTPGVHLSGGLDSSSVAVLAARERLCDALHAFCWQPPPAINASEYDRIQAVCAQERLSPVYHAVSANHVFAMLQRDGARFPNRQGTLWNEALVQRSAAERGVDVLLTGWGGDEVASFNGAGHYAELLRNWRLGNLLRKAREQSDRPLRTLLHKAVLAQFSPRVRYNLDRLRRGRLPRRRLSFVNPAFARLAEGSDWTPRNTGVRAYQLVRLQNAGQVGRIDEWAASGARHGIEYRYPLLDRRLLEFVLGLPPEVFQRGRWNRWLMRHALRDVLPSEVCWNHDKRDPACFKQIPRALVEALPKIRQELASRREPPRRAQYLDMPTLMAYIEAPDLARSSCGKVMTALSILDW